MKKILIGLVISLVYLIPTSVYAEGIEKFYVKATVEANGDLTVEEYFYLNGEFNGFEREILYRNDDLYPFRSELDYYGGSLIHNGSGIKLLEVRALAIDEDFNFSNINGTIFKEVSDADVGDFGVYTKDSFSNGEAYLIYLPDSENKAFYLKYTLENMAVVHNDIAEIYWNVLGDSLRESIGEVKITVNFPDNTDELRVWAHGPLNGLVKNVDNKSLVATATHVYSYEAIDIRGVFAKSVVPYSTKVTGVDALAKIINYETDLANQANYEREQEAYRLKENAYNEIEYCMNYVSRSCYESAQNYVSQVTDEVALQDLELKLEELHKKLIVKEEETAREDVLNAINYPTYYWYDNALNSVYVLENEELKEELLKQLVPVKKIIIESEEKKDNVIKIIGVFGIFSLLYLAYYLYKNYDKEYSSNFIHKYLREFPDNLSPSNVRYLMKKRVDEEALSSELMLLIYDKKILIEEPKEKKDILLIKNKEKEKELTYKEREIIDLIFSGFSSITLNELKKQASASTAFYNKWKKVNKILYIEALNEKLYEGDLDKLSKIKKKKKNGLLQFLIFMFLFLSIPIIGYITFPILFIYFIKDAKVSDAINPIDKTSKMYKAKKNARIISLGLIIATLFLILYLYMTNHFVRDAIYILIANIILALIILIYIPFVKKRSQKGALSYKKWRAFKNFLKDFSLMDEKDLPEVVLWERYLVYAVVLDCADKLSKTMKIKMENMNISDDTFIFDTVSFTNLNIVSHAISSSIHSSRTYSSSSGSSSSGFSSGSGGGGGFSSGGGSGGGGGGGGRF